MKQCPKCQRTYSDEMLNFCLEDGELLTGYTSEPGPGRFADDAPPTVILNEARVTNPANWPSSPPAAWQGQQGMQQQQFAGLSYVAKQDKTLPTISLVLGIASVLLVCCYGGIWLGLPAAIVGFLGMRNADSDPGRYGGRGMAIAGMVLGVVTLLGSLMIALLAIAGSN